MRHSHSRDFSHGEHSPAFSLHGLWHMVGRHHHHGRGGPGGRHGRHGFGDDDGMPRGRMVSSDDLQLLLLALLDLQPRHGYELIKALESHSNGFYSPSPGMIYPALTYLEELGFVTVELEGNRKRYLVAEPGRTHLAEHRVRVDSLLARLGEIGRKMDSVRRAFAGDDSEDGANGWVPELHEVRRRLKYNLMQSLKAPAERQRQMAAILARALAEIEALNANDQPPAR
jgi:DNA-binding PadR family transcriptional regulator